MGVAAVIGIGALATRGTTSVDDLAVGDCFVLGADDEFRRLTTPSCDDEHDSQIVAIFDVADGPDSLPAEISSYWDDVQTRCFSDAEPVVVREAEMPDETFLNFFTPNESGWDRGDRSITCYLHSPSGLEGSFVRTGG